MPKVKLKFSCKRLFATFFDCGLTDWPRLKIIRECCELWIAVDAILTYLYFRRKALY